MAVLEKGGNAFDAAAAAGFALQVVEPHLNGPGGEVPVIGHDARRGETFVVCGQGTAPAGATARRYRDLGLDLVPGSGLLAACRARRVRRLAAAAARVRHAAAARRAQLRDRLRRRPAIPWSRAISWSIASVADLFREHWHTSAEVYLPGGGVPAPGSRFANPRARRDLRARPRRGGGGGRRPRRAARGRPPRLVRRLRRRGDRQVRRHRGDGRHRGAAPRSAHRAGPVDLARPPGSAGHLRLPRPDRVQDRPVGPGTGLPAAARAAQRLRPQRDGARRRGVHPHRDRGAKLAFADREAWYGDPDFTDVPLGELLSAAYNDERRKLIGDTASTELRPGRPGGREPELPGFATRPFGIEGPDGTLHRSGGRGSGDPGDRPGDRGAAQPVDRTRRRARGDTCHLDVADRWGNVVTATPSGGWLQSSPVIPSLGFCLGTRAQMFTLDPGLPATIAPGKRPRTTLTPDAGAARRRAVPGVRHAGRGPAGPVDARLLPEPRALRDEPAAGDRLPGVPLRAHAVLVLPARGVPGGTGRRRTGSARK